MALADKQQADLALEIELGADKNWPLKRPMRERYLVVATRDYVDFSPFISDSVFRSGGSKLPSLATLPGALRIALLGNRMRGGRELAMSSANWGTTWLDLLIDKRED